MSVRTAARSGSLVTVGGGPVANATGSLVLNATYEPLCVVTMRRAVVLVLAQKAIIVECGDLVMHSARASIPVPSVVKLARYVRVPYRREVPMTRRAVLDRDAHQCVYCGVRADTIDHVRPRSRGGQHVWANVVAACARCNLAKGGRTPNEAHMHPRRAPHRPNMFELQDHGRRFPPNHLHESWLDYLYWDIELEA